MLDKLAGIEERYEEINQLLMEVGSDYQRAAELNSERVDLEPLVSLTREYRQNLARLEEARALRDAAQKDTDCFVRRVSARALAEVKDPIATEFLDDAMKKKNLETFASTLIIVHDGVGRKRLRSRL
jgi:peptide chain release factor 1